MSSHKKVIIFLLFLFFSCGKEDTQKLYPVPVIGVLQGSTKSFDLRKYLVRENSSVYLLNQVQGVSINKYQINITSARLKPGLYPINLLVDGEKFEVYIRIEKMINHRFQYEGKEGDEVYVMGVFNDWSRNGLRMENQRNNIYEKNVFMEPKKHEYKFVVNGEELIDPENSLFISNNIGGWNSILDLSDSASSEPGLLIKDNYSGNWLTYKYLSPPDGSRVLDWIVLLDNTRLHPDKTDPLEGGGLKVNIRSIENGLLRILGVDSRGRPILENQTILINGSPLNSSDKSWHFEIIYNTMIDRFFDGDMSNNKPIKDSKLHPLANFNGGDIVGIKKKAEGKYFEDLNVSALWLSPIQEQTDTSWVEWVSPNHSFTGYHGYWPVKPRSIEKRFGSSDDLKELIDFLHETEIKVLLDFVSNHVHQDHAYVKSNPEWFGNIQLPDGRKNIRLWDGGTRLTTWFDEFLPSYDYSNSPEAITQVVNDAIWWVETYNIDGFRQDAVKHVPHKFWISLTKSLKVKFPDRSLYQIGETFGSNDLIGSYVNPSELDAQFNFDIYFNARQKFASDKSNFDDIKSILLRNRKKFGPINLMGNITSSHDQLRFSAYADGQIKFSDNGTERTFNDPVKQINKKTTYNKLANFHAFNLSLPGVPIIYYGEEIGLMGEGDPGNRRMMRFELTKDEMKLKQTFSKLNFLRRSYPSLSIGDLLVLHSDGPFLVICKVYFNEIIILAINNSASSMSMPIEIPVEIKKLNSLVKNLNHDFGSSPIFKIELEPYSHDFFYAEF